MLIRWQLGENWIANIATDANAGGTNMTGQGSSFVGNMQVCPVYFMLSTTPDVTGLSEADTITGTQTDSGSVSLYYEVLGYGETVNIKGQYKLHPDGSWTAISASAGDTGNVVTSPTTDRTFIWRVLSESGVGTDKDTLYRARLIAGQVRQR